jgi:ferredoxin
MALSPDSTKADGDRSHDLRDTGAMRVTWRWPALIQAVRAVTQGISEVILQQPDDPPMGFRVALKSVDDRTCTLCEGCVNQCPSQALQVEKTPYGEMRRLRVNTSRCLGCGACVAACSEQVLAVEPDQSMMAVTTTEWTTLFADEVLRCRGCGAPLESAAFIHHVASTLQQHGFDPDALHHLQWCPACKDRQLFAPAAE